MPIACCASQASLTAPVYQIYSDTIENEVCALLRGQERKFGERIAQAFIDRADRSARFARHGEQDRALVIRAIDLLPRRSDEYLRVIAIDSGGHFRRPAR